MGAWVEEKDLVEVKISNKVGGCFLCWHKAKQKQKEKNPTNYMRYFINLLLSVLNIILSNLHKLFKKKVQIWD